MELRIESALFFNVRNKVDVLDGDDHLVYRAHSKVLSLTDETDIEAVDGRPVATFCQKIPALVTTFCAEMADGTAFRVRPEMLRVKERIEIEELGWVVRGTDIMGFHFEILDGAGAVVARADRKVLSLGDVYVMEVFDDALADFAVTVLLIVRRIIAKRRAPASAPATS